MSEEARKNQDAARKIDALNEVFEEVISDATELVKDMSWNIKTYLLFGIILILFGISEFAYNIEIMQERYYIPLFIVGVLFFAGAAQIYYYFKLRKKYSRLLRIQYELKPS